MIRFSINSLIILGTNIAIFNHGILLAQVAPIPRSIRPSEPELEQKFPDLDIIDPLALPGGAEQFLLEAPDEIFIKRIRFNGNKAIDDKKIYGILSKYEGQYRPNTDLIKIEKDITSLYQKSGFSSSKAIISDKSSFEGDKLDLHLEIIEVKLSDINIFGAKRLKKYIERSLSPLRGKIINDNQLRNKMRFLLLDERVDDLVVTINRSKHLDEKILFLEVKPAKPWTVTGLLNNEQSIFGGTFQRGISAKHLNASGSGDAVSVDYRNTDRSNILAISYDIPVTSTGGRVNLSYQRGKTEVISSLEDSDAPIDSVNIDTATQSFSAGIQQPLVQQSSDRWLQDFSLGLSFNRIDNKDQILDTPFPVTEGANANGIIRSTRLDFSQHYSRITPNSSFFLDSILGFGLNIETEIDPSLGDGSFVTWGLQGLFAQEISPRFLSVSRLNLQLANRNLIGNEQFTLGGPQKVRGFLTNLISGSNGLNLTQELRYKAVAINDHQLDILTFFDFGSAWNNSPQINESPESIASVGLGFIYQFKDLRASLTYGIPILGQQQSQNSLQGNGLTMNLQFSF